jgi:hypothetical protein
METVERTVTEREAEIVLGTLIAAERLAWDEDAIRKFQRKRAEEAERRRLAKLPVTERGAKRELVA